LKLLRFESLIPLTTPGRLRAFANSCARKVRHATMEESIAIAAIDEKRHKTKMNHYHCIFCDGYHVGRFKKESNDATL
jgi:hypothetical protein